MPKILIVPILIGLLFSCQPDQKNSYEKRLMFTDTVKLNEPNLYLKFNSFGLFDTSYQSYYANMCSIPDEYITFSNSYYTCEDSFNLTHQFTKNDTVLHMKIQQSSNQSANQIDYQFLDREINKFKISQTAMGSNTEIRFENVTNINGVDFAYFGYSGMLNSVIHSAGLNAFAIKNSSTLKISFYCFAKNISGKLDEFENVLKTTSLYQQ